MLTILTVSRVQVLHHLMPYQVAMFCRLFLFTLSVVSSGMLAFEILDYHKDSQDLFIDSVLAIITTSYMGSHVTWMIPLSSIVISFVSTMLVLFVLNHYALKPNLIVSIPNFNKWGPYLLLVLNLLCLYSTAFRIPSGILLGYILYLNNWIFANDNTYVYQKNSQYMVSLSIYYIAMLWLFNCVSFIKSIRN